MSANLLYRAHCCLCGMRLDVMDLDEHQTCQPCRRPRWHLVEPPTMDGLKGAAALVVAILCAVVFIWALR